MTRANEQGLFRRGLRLLAGRHKAVPWGVFLALLLLVGLGRGLSARRADAAAQPLHQGLALNGVRVEISPALRQVDTVGEITTVDIRITGAVNLYGAEVYIAFDPTILRVLDTDLAKAGVQIAPGTFPYPDFVAINQADNTTGVIHYAMTQQQPRLPANGDGLLATITFLTLAEGTSPVNITEALFADVNGLDIYPATANGQVQVGRLATLIGQVTFQGRGTPPAPSWSCPLSVTLSAPGAGAPTYALLSTSDQRGIFTATNILAGTYDIRVRSMNSLRNLRANQPILVGNNQVNLGLLIAGDANSDNRVSLQDLSILANTYGKILGDAGYDERADFNNDTRVNLADLSLLATNYGLQGDRVLSALAAAGPGARSLNLANPLVYISPASLSVNKGQEFEVNVYCNTGGQNIDAVEVRITFDTSRLEGMGLDPGSAFSPVPGQCWVSGGTAQYVAWTDSAKSGVFHLFRLRMRAKQVSGTTPLTISYAETDLAGNPLETGKQSGSVTVLEPTATPTATQTPTTKYVAGRVVNRAGGAGLAGAVVRLYRGTGPGKTLVREATTGESGSFWFEVSPIMGWYTLTETDPPGYTSYTATIPSGVTGNVVDANTIEFDMPSGPGAGDFIFTDEVSTITLTPTPTLSPTPTETPTPTSTLTPAPKGSISGLAFNDRNRNLLPEAGEWGVAGVTIELRDANQVPVASQLTGPDGTYAFNDLEPGTYRLRISRMPRGYIQVEPLTWAIPLGPGDAVTVNFPLQQVAGDPLIYIPLVFRP